MFLVTGATGFVGRHLVERLAAGQLAFKAVSRNPRAGFAALGDIDGSTDWREALSGVDTVLHLAARNQNVIEGADDEARHYRRVNVEASAQLAGQAAACGVRRFVFLSTIKVNGERSQPLQPFTAQTPADPQNAYALSKWQAEQALRDIAAASGMELVILRAPLVYGRDAKGSFAALVRLVNSGLPLPMASIRNRRSIIHVENLADLIVAAARHPHAMSEVLMAADGAPVSTAQLVRLIAQAADRPARLLPCPPWLLRQAGRLSRKQPLVDRLLDDLEADADETAARLGWRAPLSIEAAMAKSVAPASG